jgi:TATA-box binding protein (TBP) (component of TFIID and TFIIIB)
MSTIELYKSIFEIEDKSDEYEELDLKVINFIKMANNKCYEKIPDPNYFVISTQSAMCKFNNIFGLDLSKLIKYISEKIINNIVLEKDNNYLIKGIVIDNLTIRYDDSYIKKYKKPCINYLGNNINNKNIDEIMEMLNNLTIVDNESLKKQGKTKKKDNENFYNSCSIIVKAGVNDKCINIKLFNNGKITLTGSKKEIDGYNACCILLNELKKEKSCFLNGEELNYDDINVVDYQITMINSDFNTNFKIDLISLLTILNKKEENLFTKFNPEKYRGLIIGFYWNKRKTVQDGICMCHCKCNGKGNGEGEGKCKKITISIFKSGSVIITGGRLIKQLEDSYKFINDVFKDNFKDIVKLSILDYIDNEIEEAYGDNGNEYNNNECDNESDKEELIIKPVKEEIVQNKIKIKKNKILKK